MPLVPGKLDFERPIRETQQHSRNPTTPIKSPMRTIRQVVVVAPIAHLLLTCPQLLAAKKPNDSAAKEEALAWIDQFARVQVLFNDKDVQQLRAKVAAMKSAEAAAWWEKTRKHREMFDSRDWQDTRRWLREFLDVQAIYSDEQIRKFQTEAAGKARDSAGSLKEVMQEVINLRKKIAGGAQLSEARRKQMVALSEAYRQDQVKAREAARQAKAAAPSSGATPAPPKVRQPVRYNQPLVDSLDAARGAVLRNFYPRW